jgi:hypothetical protein
MLLVIINFGDSVFQSRDVRGAVCSGLLEFESKANGVSFCGGWSLVLTVDVLVIVFDCVAGVDADPGSDQSRRWSPDVASRSVDVFCDRGGSHNMRVTGYEQVASATRLYSIPKPGPFSCGVI